MANALHQPARSVSSPVAIVRVPNPVYPAATNNVDDADSGGINSGNGGGSGDRGEVHRAANPMYQAARNVDSQVEVVRVPNVLYQAAANNVMHLA